jgi:hypothetical protein
MTRPRDTGTPPGYNPECGLSLTCWAGQDKGPPWEARHTTGPGYYPPDLGEDVRPCQCPCHQSAGVQIPLPPPREQAS